MTRVNLASRNPCPSCGGDMTEGFDGGSDRLFEFCERERQVLRGPQLRAWWEEHDKRCPGLSKCREGAPVWRCDVEISPPKWASLAMLGDAR